MDLVKTYLKLCDIIEDNKDRQIINFHEDGTFTYIIVRSEFGNEGMSWGDENETWEVIDLVRISYNDGFMIKMGKINGEYMEGSLLSNLEDRGQGLGEKIGIDNRLGSTKNTSIN